MTQLTYLFYWLVVVLQIRSVPNSKLQIVGSSGVAASLGLNYYLKEFGGCQIAWSGSQLNLTKPLPRLDQVINVTTNDR